MRQFSDVNGAHSKDKVCVGSGGKCHWVLFEEQDVCVCVWRGGGVEVVGGGGCHWALFEGQDLCGGWGDGDWEGNGGGGAGGSLGLF